MKFKLPCLKTSIWYKCLVCQRCFQHQDRLILHRTESACRFEYRKIHKTRSDSDSSGSILPSSHKNLEIQIPDQRDEHPSIYLPTPSPAAQSTQPHIVTEVNVGTNTNEIDSNVNKDTLYKVPANISDQTDGFNCYFCDSTFPELGQLLRHNCTSQHTDGKSGHPTELTTMSKTINDCIADGRTGSNQLMTVEPLNVDLVISNESSINQYHCELCSNRFKSTEQLTQHLSFVHEVMKPFACMFCFKKFKRKCSLRVHISTIHEEGKPFACNSCSKSYHSSKILKAHISIVHDRIRPHQCNVCGKCFGQVSNLKNHVSVIHDGSRRFVCSFCDKQFTSKYGMKQHILKLH